MLERTRPVKREGKVIREENGQAGVGDWKQR
jgi:hypothetical protein